MIDKPFLLATLGRLLATPSPSGMTDAIVHLVCDILGELGIETQLTRRGAIRARLPGRVRSPKRAIAAHLDTLGAMVKSLKPSGRLELLPIGFWSSRFAEGARATVYADHGPHRAGAGLFSVNELTISIIQGLVITAGVLLLYHYTMNAGYTEAQVRTVAFSTILFSNIFLTLVNRSFYYSVFRTMTYPNRLVPLIIVITLGVLAATLYVPAVQSLFRLEFIGLDLQWKCLVAAFISVFWVEGYKLYRRRG